MKKIRKLLIPTVFVLAIAVIAWILWANTALELNTVVLQEKTLPDGFDGFRIAHISDFHSSGKLVDDVVKKLKSAEPDIICITGDLIDSGDSSVETALHLAEAVAEIAPCYFITGNHENLISQELNKELLSGLMDKGVVVLDDKQTILQRNGAQIALAGHFWGDTENVGDISDFEGYRILLSHQPEAIIDYALSGYELVLAGHAHGGQFRLPFVGGVYAPGQGFFPQYDAGVFTQESTEMVVSRGIGNSVIPLRFNNRPEVILIELKCLTPTT